jgi:hypothetical protein
MPRARWGSRHISTEGGAHDSRHRALCRPDGAECAEPRVSSRQRLCREEACMCREHQALDKGCESNSASATSQTNRLFILPVHLVYQSPVGSTFLSEQTRHWQPTNNTFLSKQIGTSHQLNEHVESLEGVKLKSLIKFIILLL